MSSDFMKVKAREENLDNSVSCILQREEKILVNNWEMPSNISDIWVTSTEDSISSAQSKRMGDIKSYLKLDWKWVGSQRMPSF